MNADYLASVDAGNGGTNAVLLKMDGGKPKSHYEPSVRAMATGDTLGLKGFEQVYDYVDWYGARYITGDDVLRITKRGLERHTGSNRYGEEFHRFLVAVALAKLGIKGGTVNLTLFAPPGLYQEAKTRIEEGFLGDGGQVSIQLSSERKPRQWRYSQVNVLPEGLGALLTFSLDEQGKAVGGDILAGEIIILDIGAFSVDALKIVDGNLNVELLEQATWQNAGVNTHLREPLLRKIHQQGDDFQSVTIDDVDALIRRGLQQGDYHLKVAGYELNLANLASNYYERYADWLSNNICDGVFNGFRGIRSVILVGGGAVMVAEKLRALYPNKILDPKQYAHVKKVHPVDMNAVGGLRYALTQG